MLRQRSFRVQRRCFIAGTCYLHSPLAALRTLFPGTEEYKLFKMHWRAYSAKKLLQQYTDLSAKPVPLEAPEAHSVLRKDMAAELERLSAYIEGKAANPYFSDADCNLQDIAKEIRDTLLSSGSEA